jgi:hypothetical protein
LAGVVAVAAVVVHLTRVLHAQMIHVQRVLLTHVLHVQLVHVLLNQNLVANAETLAVAKNESP